MLKIAIIDDEQKMLNEYNRRIEDIFENNGIEGEVIIATSDPKEFLTTVKSGLINVCIMDINLRSATNGMQLAKQIRKLENRCEIIFITGCFEFVRDAFEVQAYNFIYKPGWTNLEKTLNRLNKEFTNRMLLKRNVIDIKCSYEVYFIAIEDIVYLERNGTKTSIFTKSSELQTYEGLEDIAKRINDKRIKQCHRSIFVNIEFISCFDQKNKKLILKTGVSCDIGPKFQENFKSQENWRNFLCL